MLERRKMMMMMRNLLFSRFMMVFLALSAPACSAADNELLLRVQGPQAVVNNGILNVTLSVPDGQITNIRYNGIDNVLEPDFGINERGYWDMTWAKKGYHGLGVKITATEFKVIKQTKKQIELSFSSTYGPGGTAWPVNIDKRFIMLAGQSGFYCYGIYERLKGFPAMNILETRIAFKLDKTKFRYMAVSDRRQRYMPQYADRKTGKPLAYPEAVLLTNPADPSMKGQVDDKYMYSADNRDAKVHGWVSSNPSVGFWMITPSNEFRTGGPLKQELTSHTGPITLAMFVSLHYAGPDSGMYFKDGAPWKKVVGPVFVYLNGKGKKASTSALWADAKAQATKETNSWPYTFPASKDYLTPDKRGRVTGVLSVCDLGCREAANASVGLAAPGAPGSWQLESQGYQFWVDTNSEGAFTINGVRPGTYDLFGWVPGVVGDYKHTTTVTVKPGASINLGKLTYHAPRTEKTLWEIGTPDRTAAEFLIPEPHPTPGNPLMVDDDSFRQYGLWLQYSQLYPEGDLVYTVGAARPNNRIFFAHVNRPDLRPTTWTIKFGLKSVVPDGEYVLRVAIAASNVASLEVRVNDRAGRAMFTTGQMGQDSAIARHAIHGIYALFNVPIPSSKLVSGDNSIFLTQPKNSNQLQGLMYDYLRLEGPSH